MPIFISYSHADVAFVNILAAHLVKQNAHVWVDTWELNVGDSILGKVQQAIQESSALLVVLSKASVASEWCRKELSAGLMRELDEKRVIVLPVLLEDCEIPMFLREKMYADFRTSFESGLNVLVNAVARVTNADQGRIKSEKGNTDWAEDWGYEEDGLFRVNYTIVETSPDMPFTCLTEISIKCNNTATSRYEEYVKEGLEWFGRLALTEVLAELADQKDFRVLLKNQFPQIVEVRLTDSKRNTIYDVTVRCRRLGEDNGKDQLVNISNHLRQIRDYMRQVTRKPTQEELERIVALVARRL